MRILMFVFSVMILCSQQSHAIFGYLSGQGCPSSVRNDHLVISFEGLGNMGVNQSNISNRFARVGYTPANYPFEGVSFATACAIEWKKKKPNLRISITGHSCGGSSAIMTAQALGKKGIRVADVLTIDPACIARPLFSYVKPANVDQFINFNGSVGFNVSGAQNCNGGIDHIGMPGNASVQRVAYIMLTRHRVQSCGSGASPGEEPGVETAQAEDQAYVQPASYTSGNAESDSAGEETEAPAIVRPAAKKARICENSHIPGLWDAKYCRDI